MTSPEKIHVQKKRAQNLLTIVTRLPDYSKA